MSTKGLEGVVAAETRLSQVLGEQGRLIYGGYEIGDLAEHVAFEEVCHLLWHGSLPDQSQLGQIKNRLADERPIDDRLVDLLRRIPHDVHPMSALRTGVSAAAFFDPEAEDPAPEANQRKALRLTARIITIATAFERIRNGKDPVPPRGDLDHAANFLYMLRGEEPDPLAARIMDAAFTLHAEHGLNASTFSARVTVATLSDLYSGETSAIGTLKGPLHGGANERVMAMLQEIPGREGVDEYVRKRLDAGDRIMGFGHRVYRTLDPRAPILKRFAEQYAGEAGETRWLDIANAIVAGMAREMEARGKRIYPNVDFFSAPLYYTMGVPTDQFTPIFACARTAGWTAHMLEQLADNRLIRPKAAYIGPTDLEVEPIDERRRGGRDDG